MTQLLGEVAATQLLRSAQTDDCMRGMKVLSGLERVVLDKALACEMSAASVVLEVGADTGRAYEERAAAWMSAFTLSVRNCKSSEICECLADESKFVHCFGSLTEDLYGGERLNVREVVSAYTRCCGLTHVLIELTSKGSVVEQRSAEAAMMSCFVLTSKQQCSDVRLQELLPLIVDGLADDDIVVACFYSSMLTYLVMGSFARVQCLLSSDVPRAAWKLQQRIVKAGQPVSWWNERAEVVHLDTVCLTPIASFVWHLVGVMTSIPQDSLWGDMLEEAIHMIKINHTAELSAQHKCPFFPFALSGAIVAM